MALNNGFGTGVFFSTGGISQLTGGTSGSVLSFQLKKSADKKEITDGSDNYFYVGITKRKKEATVEVLFTDSRSMGLSLPDVGDTATFTQAWSNDITGSWGVIDSNVNFKSDDAAKVTYTVCQWYKANGTTLP